MIIHVDHLIIILLSGGTGELMVCHRSLVFVNREKMVGLYPLMREYLLAPDFLLMEKQYFMGLEFLELPV